MLLQYFDAIEQHQTRRADFIEKRFRPEFAEAFQRWLETKPFENSRAPSTPFDLPGYKVKERTEAEAKSELAADNIKKGYAALANARSYSFLAVMFTIVLFLGGISAKLSNSNQKRFIVSLSVFFLVLAFLRMIRLPLAP